MVQVVSVVNRVPDRSREPYYRYDMFLASMKQWDEAPVILGMNEPWGGLMTKPRRLRSWLRSGGCGEEVMIVCDAFDIIFTVRAGEVARRYLDIWEDRPIVFNAERSLFPRAELEYAFIHPTAQSRYLNSGFFVGPPDKILAMLEAMWLDDIQDDHIARDDLHGGNGSHVNPNDQGWYQLMFAAQVVPMELDYSGRLCKSLSGCSLEEFDLEGDRICDRAGNEPLVFHFNGGSKNTLMPAFLRKLGLE